jgi:queuine/archaeosine tRNA-ribosyltransferase
MAQQLDAALKMEKKKNDTLFTQVQGMKSGIEKLATAMKPLEQTLSCLSCVKFMSEVPMTLVCGHSICKTVSDIF